MVEYNKAYHGSTNIAYIEKNGEIIHKIYKGSTLVYKLGFDTVTFNPSSSLQSFTVPLGVSKIHFDCVASKGYTPHSSAAGGKGGRVQCDIEVNGGETFYIMVGDVPSDSSVTYNASDIRFGGNTLNDRIIVAGGGGSGCYVTNPFTRYAAGGVGGGLTGGTGEPQSVGGQGGTQSAGGLGAYGADAYDPYRSASGTLGFGGATGSGGNVDAGGNAGAGGAGYYGGGGSRRSAVFFGGSQRDTWARGAGGGSSYTNANCSNVVHTQGYRDGAGYVTISFVS
jgi:hypothetical protein